MTPVWVQFSINMIPFFVVFAVVWLWLRSWRKANQARADKLLGTLERIAVALEQRGPKG